MCGGLRFNFQSTESLLCYIMRTGSGHYQSFGAHFLCFQGLFCDVLPLAVTISLPATRLHLQGWSIVPKASLKSFHASLVIVIPSYHNPLDTCPRKACFLKEGYLFRLNDGEIMPRSSCFPRREICRWLDRGGFHFELVKMKHVHFKKVSPQFSQQILFILTLLQLISFLF